MLMPHTPLSLPKPFLLILLALSLVIPLSARSQPPVAQQHTELHLGWDGTPGINRYRLQVSTDPQFTDLVFDRAVDGREYVINDLPFGKYYWRVAPASAETGTYSAPRTVEIKAASQSETGGGDSRTPGVKPSPKTGWSAATGTILQPQALALRDQSAPDIVGVNADGMVYALDATNGTALWTARFRPDAKRGEQTGNGGAVPFQPIALSTGGGLNNLLVANEGGVRLIEGASGRELWRAALQGRAATAGAGDVNGDGTMEVAVFEDNPAGLSILDAATGKALAHVKLDVATVGAPAAVTAKTGAGFLLALADGTLDLRNINGERVRSTKLDVLYTTPPLILHTPQVTQAMIGSDHGLLAIDVATLKPLWRVATEGDAPRGHLSATDFDGDGTPEVVMITRRGRTVVIGSTNGKIRWYANIPNRAGTTVLTDLNGDNLPDVLVAADSTNFIGHDGRSGAVIFGDEKGALNQAGTAADGSVIYQTCAYLSGRNDKNLAPLLICNDPAGGGLRADNLPSMK